MRGRSISGAASPCSIGRSASKCRLAQTMLKTETDHQQRHRGHPGAARAPVRSGDWRRLRRRRSHLGALRHGRGRIRRGCASAARVPSAGSGRDQAARSAWMKTHAAHSVAGPYARSVPPIDEPHAGKRVPGDRERHALQRARHEERREAGRADLQIQVRVAPPPAEKDDPHRRGDDHHRVARLVREDADHAQDRPARRLRESQHGLGDLRKAQRDRARARSGSARRGSRPPRVRSAPSPRAARPGSGPDDRRSSATRHSI